MRDGEPNVYGALGTMRNGYTQMQWQRVQMFLVFNTVAFPLVFGTQQPEGVKILLSVAAVVIHVMLIVATIRADRWIDYMDARMAELERLDPDDPLSGIRVSVFNNPEFGRMRHSPFASRRIFGLAGVTLTVLWISQSIILIRAIFH